MDTENQAAPEPTAQKVQSEIKKCNHVPIIIILIIFAICGFAFGGVELWQNNILHKEKAELELAIAESSKNNKNELQDNRVLEYEYTENYIPPVTYKIKLSFSTGELYVYEYHSCSAVDCDGDSFENAVFLTDQELEKISIITKENNYDKEYLSSALSSLVRDTDEMAQIDDALWEYYKDCDFNDDGVVTYREFGNNYLDMIIEEQM